MKKSLLFCLVAFFMTGSHTPCFSSYIVTLKNGKQFITERYWKEDGQIKCNLYGGITGFDESTILSVKESNLPYTFVEEKPKPTEVINDSPQAETEAQDPTEQQDTPSISEDDKKILTEDRDRRLSEIDEISDALKTAKKENNRNQHRELRKKLLSAKTDIAKLFNEIKEKNGGTPPEWWPTLRMPDKKETSD